MNKLLYSGLVTQSRSISVSGTLTVINYTKSCPLYWHHIHPFNTSLISSHVNIRFALNSEHTSILCHIHGPLPEPQGPAHQLIPPVISEALRQSAGLILARISDVTHHPMSHITYAHNIPTSNTILRRNIIPSDIMISNPYLLQMHILVYNIIFTSQII